MATRSALFRYWQRGVGDGSDLLGLAFDTLRSGRDGGYALVGPSGVSAHSSTLLTRDLDVVMLDASALLALGEASRDLDRWVVTAPGSRARIVIHEPAGADALITRARPAMVADEPVLVAGPADIVELLLDQSRSLLVLAMLAQLVEMMPPLVDAMPPDVRRAFDPATYAA